VIDLAHPLARLARTLDWTSVTAPIEQACRAGPGHPPLPARLVAGLLILKHRTKLSDAALSERWLENPYFQFLCGEAAFRHQLPFDRSSISRWKRRLGKEAVDALLRAAEAAERRSPGPSPVARVQRV
jgi:IS5 family transposase